MLINLKEMLEIAEKYNFTVGAYNVTESSMFEAIVEAAEENDAPTIIAAAVNEFNFAKQDFYKYVTQRLMKSKIPFVLHLDHAKTYEDCARAIQAGFTSVMIDGSLLDYDKNVALTQKVIDLAHPLKISVEAEIGTIGTNADTEEGGVEGITYTKVEDVLDFTKKCEIDALAIAIGTAHGQYPKGYTPHLNLDLLKKIRHSTSIPLVLHGGSNNPDCEIEEACRLGVRKVNISSDFKLAYYREIEHYLNETHDFYPARILPYGMKKVKEVVCHKMELFHCIDKAKYYK